MAYNIYLTRSSTWIDDIFPITIDEIEKIKSLLPENFYIEYDGIVSATAPDGRTLSIDVGPYLCYEDKLDKNSRTCIFFNSSCPYFRVKDAKYLLPIIELAELLDAKVQGDDLEVYTKDLVLDMINATSHN